MESIHVAITVDRPIHDVFDYVTDIPRQREWFTGIKGVRPVSTMERGIGSELDVDVVLFGWRFTSRMNITDYAPPGRMALLSSRSTITFSARYSFEPVGDGTATRVMLDSHVIASSYYRLLGPAFAPMLRNGLRRRFARLKQVVESGAADRRGQAGGAARLDISDDISGDEAVT